MLIKPFTSLLKDQMDPTVMSYLGCVEDNNDPEKLGRVRVRVAPYMDLDLDKLPWASPILGTCGNSTDSCGLNVPEVGSQVRVTFPSRDFTAPYYTGAELNSTNRSTFFDEDYPFTYGYKDSIGNFYRINKERGTAQFQHYTSTNAQVAPDGSIKVTLSNGAFFLFDNGNNFEINIKTLDVSGTADGTLTIKANNELDIETPQTNIKGNVNIDGDLNLKNGVSGSFVTMGNFVTVENGIIVSIQ